MVQYLLCRRQLVIMGMILWMGANLLTLLDLHSSEAILLTEESLLPPSQNLSIADALDSFINTTSTTVTVDKAASEDGMFSMILIRAIGNSLPPRHDVNQTINNLAFTLEHEEQLPRLSKHWILNRIVDDTVLQRAINLLEHYNETYTTIPFVLSDYDEIAYRYDRVADDQVGRVPLTEMMDAAVTHEKVVYSININGARNAMIRYGKQHSNATYILPFDGNCFLTRAAWQKLQDGLKDHPDKKYFFVPLDRLDGDNHLLLNQSYVPQPNEEPQIMFRRDSQAEYNPKLRYGNKNKVELMFRLKRRKLADWKTWERKEWLDGRPRLAEDAVDARWSQVQDQRTQHRSSSKK